MGGARKSPAQKDVTKIIILGLIRPKTSTCIYIEHMSHCDSCLIKNNDFCEKNEKNQKIDKTH